MAQKLREAGAVILGKTNLSEWANIRSSHSVSGWSGRGGLTRNPYALDRNPCGSSSGSGAAVGSNLCVVAVGTETDGSVVCPSSANGIVGLKPTLGLISRAGIIPIAHSQDTSGPMARTVAGCRDFAECPGRRRPAGQCHGRRQGKNRGRLHELSGSQWIARRAHRRGTKILRLSDSVDDLMSNLMEEMKRQGAVLVDPPISNPMGSSTTLNLRFYFMN